MKTILSLFVLILILAGCSKENVANIDTSPKVLNFNPSISPFVVPIGAKFYSNIKYDVHQENVFDLFVPNSNSPTGLVIQIHGGGFVGGDKTSNYNEEDFQNEVNSFLQANVAYATLNYRLLQPTNEQDGVLKPLNDCKRALQFIRFHNNDFNLNKSKVVLKGGSAGAGTSLWIGLQDDMAQSNATDLILRESTRVKAIETNGTQSSYDLVTWPEEVFSEYQNSGFNLSTLISTNTQFSFLQFYGITNLNEMNTSEMIAYRYKVNMLNLISSDDPDIYLISQYIPNIYPSNKNILLHHPLHSKALLDKAIIKNINCKAFIPEMGINTTNGESSNDFLLRKLNE